MKCVQKRVAETRPLFFVEVDSNAAGLNHPNGALDRVPGTRRQEISKPREQFVDSELRACLENDDSRMLRWLETQHLSEATIKSQQDAPFLATSNKEQRIARTLESFIHDCFNIMSARTEKFHSAPANVFINFQPHAPLDTGRMRSREASAP